MPVVNANALIDQRVDALRDYHQRCGSKRAELDLSGGIDSAVMAGLLCLALGPDQLTLVYSSINSGKTTQHRAQTLADAIGASMIFHDLTPTYEAMVAAMLDNLEASGIPRPALNERLANDPTILGSIRSCLRAPLGRGYLRMTGNGLRHGTGNECEDRWLRFYQKGGDGEVDSNPIAMLSKGEVYQLARELGIRLNAEAAYAAIINAAPTPELWGANAAHTDEDEIGAYLGIVNSGHTFYSYIDADSGQYTRIGLIERIARFADTDAGVDLFEDSIDASGPLRLIDAAQSSPCFAGVEPSVVEQIVRAARRTERITRHKENPNCPTMGSRADLIDAGILTDELPSIGNAQ